MPPGVFNHGAASIAETRRAIDKVLVSTGYSCKTISWDDANRGQVFGTLSALGSNITDTYLKSKDGTSLFTVRSDNWNEKLGVVHAEDIALLIGNCETGGKLHNITLKQFLDHPGILGGGYAGIQGHVRLSDISPDAKVSIRFQTVFLPVEEGDHARGKMQFAAEAYNYATTRDDNPRNLILLATTQGLSVQADGVGAKRLLLHAGSPGHVNEYWLEAESSRHKVGGEQKETAAEREDALRRGKATSEVIGIKAMGTRFNVLMTIQIPLLQKSHGVLFGSAKPGFGGPSLFKAPSKQVGFGQVGGQPGSIFGSQQSPLFGESHSAFATRGFGAQTKSSSFGAPSLFSAASSTGVCEFGAQSFGSPIRFAGAKPTDDPFSTFGGEFGGPSSPSPGTADSNAFGSQLSPVWSGFSGSPSTGVLGTQNSQSPSAAGIFRENTSSVDTGNAGAASVPAPRFCPLFSSSELSDPHAVVSVDHSDPSSVFGPVAQARMLLLARKQMLQKGRASAARVSRGEFHAKHRGLSIAAPSRNSAEAITVTCVLYYTVVGGVPNETDVLSAVADLDRLYGACSASGSLADAAFSFMKSELTQGDMTKINEKALSQFPLPGPPPSAYHGSRAAPGLAHVPASAVNAIVMEKCRELECAMIPAANTVLELRLLSFGALQSNNVQTLLGTVFDEIFSALTVGDGFKAKALFQELKSLIQGYLSSQ